MELLYLYFILSAIIGVIFPIYGLWGGPQAKKMLTDQPEKLIQVYLQSIIIQVILTAAVFIVIYSMEDSADFIGMSFLQNPLLIIIVWLTPLLFLLILHKMKIPSERVDTIKAKYSDVSYLMPRKRAEYRWAIVLSFAAGTFEEILYRGYLFWFLSLYMSIVPAIILVNLVFGILHFGTGLKNAAGAFVLGLVFSALSVPIGSLWLAILAHILVDIYSFSMGYKVYRVKD